MTPRSGADECHVERYVLERAALARARSEQQIVDAIAVACIKRVSGDSASANASAPQPKRPNNAMAPSLKPADIARVKPSGRCRDGRVGSRTRRA